MQPEPAGPEGRQPGGSPQHRDTRTIERRHDSRGRCRCRSQVEHPSSSSVRVSARGASGVARARNRVVAPGGQGWQRATRRTASQLPRSAPCALTAATAYAEQVGCVAAVHLAVSGLMQPPVAAERAGAGRRSPALREITSAPGRARARSRSAPSAARSRWRQRAWPARPRAPPGRDLRATGQRAGAEVDASPVACTAYPPTALLTTRPARTGVQLGQPVGPGGHRVMQRPAGAPSTYGPPAETRGRCAAGVQRGARRDAGSGRELGATLAAASRQDRATSAGRIRRRKPCVL